MERRDGSNAVPTQLLRYSEAVTDVISMHYLNSAIEHGTTSLEDWREFFKTGVHSIASAAYPARAWRMAFARLFRAGFMEIQETEKGKIVVSTSVGRDVYRGRQFRYSRA